MPAPVVIFGPYHKHTARQALRRLAGHALLFACAACIGVLLAWRG